jgi:hypothetical protein
MRAAVFSVALLVLWSLSSPSVGEPPHPAPPPSPVDLERALAAEEAKLKSVLGEDHPELQRVRAKLAAVREAMGARADEPDEVKKARAVIAGYERHRAVEEAAARARAAQKPEPAPKGRVLVLSQINRQASATLRDPEIRTLGGKTFIVGVHENNDIIRAGFDGKRYWIPLDTVDVLVELGDEPAKKKEK